MKTINKCLKEWNAIIEALGQGKQSILIRYYKTYIKEFLLYPTFYYSTSDDYLDSFQRKHHSFVEKNALPRKEDKKAEIKYYARLEKISEKSSLRIGTLQNFYVWTPEHVKSYLKGRTAYIWALRVYELPEPFMANTSQRAIRFANLKEDISLEGI
ncbi:MAG: DUF1802 family protein, partial [Methanobacterium sp.]